MNTAMKIIQNRMDMKMANGMETTVQGLGFRVGITGNQLEKHMEI